ncbi:unnamed protein product [Clonostachys chloroleuca]|uniref:Uncharacterized protein n=1 Tax=Clonostachys chloroleuca TaxID=1926264 RepID=A0AA35M7Y4_9HYPO|nr:unnamed protein product [Clonostachys chloroleuca]
MAIQEPSTAPKVPPEESTKRFVLNSILLSLIEPVRGEPTVYSLDRHPHDNASPIAKFLDSFALICSTKSGKDTVSAVCIEQGGPTGTILRLARNTSTSEELLLRFQAVLDDLTLIAKGGCSLDDKAWELMSKIVELDRFKIDSIIEIFQKKRDQELIQAAVQRLETGEFSNNGDFLEWAGHLPSLLSLSPGTETAELIKKMHWAAQARWVYSAHLQRIAFPESTTAPAWINNIYKLGRYHAALLAMIKLATTRADLFIPIRVELVEPPPQAKFSLNGESEALRNIIRKCTKAEVEDIESQLSVYWLKDADAHFRKACKARVLTVHAEMQLACFYDNNMELTPRFLFMGTSKKACFHCSTFLCRHERRWSFSATHSKLYPNWMPPLFSTGSVRQIHLKLIWDINQYLEKTIGRELETKLRIPRSKKVVFDSTAGPSLTTFVLGGEFTFIKPQPQTLTSEPKRITEEEDDSSS